MAVNAPASGGGSAPKNRKIRLGIINTAPSTTEPLLYRRHLPAARPERGDVRRLPSGAAQSIDAKYLQRREAWCGGAENCAAELRAAELRAPNCAAEFARPKLRGAHQRTTTAEVAQHPTCAKPPRSTALQRRGG